MDLQDGCCGTSSNPSGEISFAYLSISGRPGGSYLIVELRVLVGERFGVLSLFQALRSVCMGGNPFLFMHFHHLVIKPSLSLLPTA